MVAHRRARHRLFVAVRRDHRWVAWLENDRLVEFHRQKASEELQSGDIHLGRIVRVDKGLGAAFVDIGRKQAVFLPLSELSTPAVEGARTIVQIEREGRGEKSPRGTARPALAGARVVLMPGRRGSAVSEKIVDKGERSRLSALMNALAEVGESFMARTSAVGATERELRREAAALRASWRDLLELERSRQPPAVLHRQLSIDIGLLRDHGPAFDEIVYDDRRAAAAAAAWCQSIAPELTIRIVFRRDADWVPPPSEILEEVEEAIQPHVALRSGGSLVIEPTEAMTVIDVNAESATGTHASAQSERALLRVNLAAVDEIARQIRLRNVGGIAVIDFIDLKDANGRRQIVDRLRAAVARDSAPVWVGAMSRLGLVELTRRRRGPTLVEIMMQSCRACGGTGHVARDHVLYG
ncbi:MAG: ribonuclease E/G [Dongiaceae bacterium]